MQRLAIIASNSVVEDAAGCCPSPITSEQRAGVSAKPAVSLFDLAGSTC